MQLMQPSSLPLTINISQYYKWLLSSTFAVLMLCVSPLTYANKSLERPEYLGQSIIKSYFDGIGNDLLTAGWTHDELAKRQLPADGDFNDPTWLRRAAYYNNIIALIDTTTDGGYGSIYGPLKKQSSISGYEYLSYSLDKNGAVDATLMLQIPDHFNHQQPCVVVAASSGSRGIYGAVGTVGSWALTKKCAVAYTDKGTGTGFYFFDKNASYDIQGRYINDSNSVKTRKAGVRKDTRYPLLFSHNINSDKQAFLQEYPTAVAVKQAHSEKNVEKDWGKFVIQAGQFALYQLNQHFQHKANKTFDKDNTVIIAASISNGGGASLRAAEQDTRQLFDGVVVAEPNIYPPTNNKLSIYQGNNKIPRHSVPGLTYFLNTNLFAPCALLTDEVKTRPFYNSKPDYVDNLTTWCNDLKNDGFITGKNTLELANHSLKKLTDLGIANNQQTLSSISQLINLWPALAITYSNQIGKFKLEDNLCNTFFTALDSNHLPVRFEDKLRLGMFSKSNGIPPTAGISFASTEKGFSNYQRAKCLYQLTHSKRIENGMNELIATGNLKRIPTIILHGREDNLIAPNHSSRPYYANAVLNNSKSSTTQNSNIRYYEVNNAQHFDAFLSLPHFAGEYIPLHYYFEQSLDLMLAHLRDKAQLPESQLITTKTRRMVEGDTQLTLNHLPSIKNNPKNKIKVENVNGVISLRIPE